MSCQEIEPRILDYQENQLSPAQRQAVETHLASCAGCRALAQDLRQLDAALSRGLSVPALSVEFDGRLRERLQAGPATSPEIQRAERKRQLEAEFEAGRARLIRGSFALGNLLNHLTRPLLAASAGWLAWRFLPHSILLSASGPMDLLTLLVWLMVSAAFLTLGLAEAFPRRWKALSN